MGQVLRTTSDYDIIIREGGTITLNTGSNVGTVRVTGNLLVEGDSLTVSAENLNVQDNIIILNFGETGAGISLGYSGIQVDRGTLQPASIIYDESTDVWMFAKGSPENSFNFSDSAIRTRFIRTSSDVDDGDLTIIGTGTGVVKVGNRGANGYETYVTDDDDIPNKLYVDTAILSNPTFQIKSPGISSAADTRVLALDSAASYPVGTFPIGPFLNAPTESEVSIVVNNRRIAAFRQNQIEFTGLTFFTEDPGADDITTGILGNPGQPITVTAASNGITYKIIDPGNTNFISIGSANNFIGTIFTATGSGIGTGTIQLVNSDYEGQGAAVIQSDNTNANIKLETNGTGKVVINYALQLDSHGITPAYVNGSSLLYAGSVSAGTSGLYTVNSGYIGELVLKNRALLFSMIF